MPCWQKPCQANAKSEVLTPCVQSDNWNSAICRVIVVGILLPMLGGSRQLESLAGQQLIVCTGETFPADHTIAANHLTHLLDPIFWFYNFMGRWSSNFSTSSSLDFKLSDFHSIFLWALYWWVPSAVLTQNAIRDVAEPVRVISDRKAPRSSFVHPSTTCASGFAKEH